MSFSDAVTTLPEALRLWVLWLTLMMIAAPAVALVFRATRGAGLVLLATNAAVALAMHLLYAEVGFVRLLGLPHVVIWTPLAVWLALRLRRPGTPGVPRAVLAVFLVSIVVSLVFDYADVIRWLAGDQAPMTEGWTA